MTSDPFEDSINQACADGRMSVEDAEEVRTFRDFLADLRGAGIPGGLRDATDEQRKQYAEIYKEHYPEDYARAIAESRHP